MIDLTLTTFTPAQAERITGNTVTQQRNLRRHGYLAKEAGHARFNVHDLARLLVIQCMSEKGIGPNMIAKLEDSPWDIATLCATGIVHHLLGWSDAYEGDASTFTLPGPPARPMSSDKLEIVRLAMASIGEEISDEELQERSLWGSRADYLRRQVLRTLNLARVIPEKYFIWWGDGSHVWHGDLTEAFGQSSTEPMYHSAIVILDLEALASALCDRAQTAFVHVEEVEE